MSFRKFGTTDLWCLVVQLVPTMNFLGVKHFESEPSMIRLPVVDRNPTKTTKFFYKEKVPLIIYIIIYIYIYIFAGSNPTRTS